MGPLATSEYAGMLAEYANDYEDARKAQENYEKSVTIYELLEYAYQHPEESAWTEEIIRCQKAIWKLAEQIARDRDDKI